jgi:surface carbohydrate biosynthesis protein (TIGR04326 family)
MKRILRKFLEQFAFGILLLRIWRARKSPKGSCSLISCRKLTGSTLHIVSSSFPDIAHEGTILRWSDHARNETEHSAPALHQTFFLRIRAEYLQWVHSVGEYSINGHTVRDLLRLQDGHSAWWLTPIFDRHPFTFGPGLFEIFKLRSLELWLEHNNFTVISLHIPDNRMLCETLQNFCQATGRYFICSTQFHHVCVEQQQIQFSSIGKFFYGCKSLIHWLMRERSQFPYKPKIDKIPGRLIGTWFPNIDQKRAEQNEFYSMYWGDLHYILDELQDPLHWLFIYSKEPENIRRHCERRDRFLETKKNVSMTYWQECVGVKEAWRALSDFLHLAEIGEELLPKLRALCEWPDSQLNITAYIQPLWRNFFFSEQLLRELLMREGIRKYSRLAGKQRLVITSSERQQWERELFAAQREEGSDLIIAANHSRIARTDFRYFECEQSRQIPEFSARSPDIFVCNGEEAYAVMKESAFPEERLACAEALRFQYLRRWEELASGPKRLLVCTSYFSEEIDLQLRILAQALDRGLKDLFDDICVKPHPAIPVVRYLAKYFPKDSAPRLVFGSMADWLLRGTVFYVGHSSSVSLEVAYGGLPLIIQAAGDNFGLCPFEPQAAHFVGDATSLLEACKSPSPAKIGTDFFYLDNALPRWRRLLQMGFPDRSG